MKFYLGTGQPSWLERIDVPLFLARNAMPKRRMPRARTSWCLDSGGFSALDKGAWHLRTRHPYRFTTTEYAADVRRYQQEIGMLDWAAPMDWVCEPFVVWKHDLGVRVHQERTLANFAQLRADLGDVIIPVLQGWEAADYAAHVEMYDSAGFDLRQERVVGVGSVCRRLADTEIGSVLRLVESYGIRIHAFGVRGNALVRYAEILASADSQAWSKRARSALQPGPWAANEVEGRWCCSQPQSSSKCVSCPEKALRWRERLLARLPHPGQLRLEVS